mmetsp:Transcript_118878/g.380894  ORF Transcript_118878/g.380894 Transcript_118878/m.380894 type:complete len:316 (-) Transcript_118878:356-1303(-)
MHIAQCIPGSDIALQAGEATVALARNTGCSVLERFVRIARQLPGGESALDTLGQVLHEVGFLAATAESPGLALDIGPNATPLLQETTEKAEALKLEAAGRLAEMLTRAERLAEREFAETFERISPEIGKLSLALQAKSRGFRAHVQRAFGACDSLGRSVFAWSMDVASRMPSAGEALVRCLERELDDMQAQRAERLPGWRPFLEAYSRVFCSAVCEAFLELAPQIRRSRRQTSEDVANTVPRTPPLRERRHRSQSPHWRAAQKEQGKHADRRTVSLSPSPPPHSGPAPSPSLRGTRTDAFSSSSSGTPLQAVPGG